MPINFNGTNIDKIIYNGTTLDKVIYNGVIVWENFKYTTPNLTVSTDSANNDFVFRIQNSNPYELLVTIAVEGENYCNYQKIQANGLSTVYDYISNSYDAVWVNIEVSYYKTDKTLIETYNFDYFVPMLPETTTTTTTYALGEPTSTEGNFKYYQGGKNARPINK